METYVIKRTGRRNRPEVVNLASGESLRLNATGTHVRELTEDDVAVVKALPGVTVIQSKSKVAQAPAPPPPDKKKKATKKKTKAKK